VCDAKPIIRQQLIESGDAIGYYEPENTVMSRSGDECVVALTDQWYLAYGDPEWQQIVSRHIHSENFNGYNDKIMEKFDQVLGWLKEWACSRQFGLGTQLPWDEKWVIESLSDSTIYMAYYTIAHLFHGGLDNLAGYSGSPSGIAPEDLNDDVFNFIFLRRPLPEGHSTRIPEEQVLSMRAEFEYWYPFDLRVSAHDLIPNHLTMSLYNHVEVWKDRPELWPRGIYCNGHVMVDAEKMSKSKGNFLMLKESVDEYSADALRFALADAGDSMEDANFDRSVANQAIIELYKEEEWCRSIIADRTAGKLRGGAHTFMDRVLNNEIDFLIEATFTEFQKMCYRDGIHRCWYDMIIARDIYRDWSVRCGIPMHEDVALRFVEALVVMMAPICPHWSEGLWEALGKEGSVCNTTWPAFTPYDRLVKKQNAFFKDFLKNARQALLKAKVADPKGSYVYLANTYEPRKVEMLRFLQSVCDGAGVFSADIMKQMKDFVDGNPELTKDTRKALMQFGAFMIAEAKDRGIDALAEQMVFDQKAILQVRLRTLKDSFLNYSFSLWH
jgi:leucyl-tRNA synthetase